MDVWGWIVVYAVGLTLLQLLVYRYLLNNGGSLTRRVGTPFGDGERDASVPNGSSGSSNSSGSNGPSGAGDADGEPRVHSRRRHSWARDDVHVPGQAGGMDQTNARRCPHCGAENELDATFSRCWNCTREL
jgi:hypothetical protein